MNTPDGGSAFPSDFVDLPGSGFSKGMSLRDYLAAAPMNELEMETLRQAFATKFPGKPLSIAALRYFRADTMLEVRAQWYNENQAPAPLQAPIVIPPQPGEEMS